MMSGNEKVKMDKKVFTLSDISEFSKKHFQNERDENKELLPLLGNLVELLNAYVCHDIEKAVEEGRDHIVFVNFWKLDWPLEGGAAIFEQIHSSFNSSSAARRLTAEYNAADEQINQDIEKRFLRSLSRGSDHLQMIEKLSSMARENNTLFDDKLKMGKNVVFLFRVLFTSILHLTFDKDGIVDVYGLGEFYRGFRLQQKHAAKDTKGGVLHFNPKFSV